jgi:hypothetical protein
MLLPPGNGRMIPPPQNSWAAQLQNQGATQAFGSSDYIVLPPGHNAARESGERKPTC